MKNTFWITAIGMLLTNASIGFCRLALADSLKSSSTDYDYDYDEEDDSKAIYLDPTQSSGTFSIAPPYFDRSKIEVKANQGESALLYCNVRNYRNDSNTIMWYKGDTLISVGHDPVSNRYESLENNSIRISKVELEDAGDYFCTVLPQKVRLQILLKVKKSESETLAPYFEKDEIEVIATQGEAAVLNCDVKNFNNDPSAIMWYKGNTLISVGHNSMSSRYEALNSTYLRINKVETYDAGHYYCVVQQKARLHIELKVKGLQILCNGLDFTNRTMNKKQGASFSCECVANMMGNVEIKWSINGVRAENVVTKLENGKFFIDNADSEHEGMYQCLGEDNSSKPTIVALAIYVNYEPKVSTHRHHVNTEIGGKAELYCDYKANPIAIVRWRKNDNELSYSEKYNIKNFPHHSRNRTILEIKNIDKDDLGEYECHVENTIGANNVRVFLILEPETPQFEDMEINGNIVRLHWLVRSLQPLSEAILDYKMSGTYTWSTVSVLSTKRHAQEGGMWKITHEMELLPGKWHSRVKTRNTVGWSKFSPQHDFIIHDLDDENQLDKEIPPQDMVMAAGIGLNKKNNASPKFKSRIVPFVAVTTYIITMQRLFATTIFF